MATLWELSKMEQRYDAMLGVIRDGFTVTEAAQKAHELPDQSSFNVNGYVKSSQVCSHRVFSDVDGRFEIVETSQLRC